MDNLRSMGFKIHIGSATPLEKLKVLCRALFSQMRIYKCHQCFKILICETAGGCLAYNYFRRVYFFFAPIILDIFQDIADRVIARGMVV